MGTLAAKSIPNLLLVNMISDMPHNKELRSPRSFPATKLQILQIVLSYFCISQHYLWDGRIAVLECICEESIVSTNHLSLAIQTDSFPNISLRRHMAYSHGKLEYWLVFYHAFACHRFCVWGRTDLLRLDICEMSVINSLRSAYNQY